MTGLTTASYNESHRHSCGTTQNEHCGNTVNTHTWTNVRTALPATNTRGSLEGFHNNNYNDSEQEEFLAQLAALIVQQVKSCLSVCVLTRVAQIMGSRCLYPRCCLRHFPPRQLSPEIFPQKILPRQNPGRHIPAIRHFPETTPQMPAERHSPWAACYFMSSHDLIDTTKMFENGVKPSCSLSLST